LPQMGGSLQTEGGGYQNGISISSCVGCFCEKVDSCRDCRQDQDKRGKLVLQHPSYAQDLDMFEAPLDLPRVACDFAGRGAVPSGWRRAENVAVPSGFRYFGGDSVVIEDLSSQRRRVLVALPAWAVDMGSARWLIKLRDGPKSLVRLWNAEPNCDDVILEFDLPRVESVAQQCAR